MGGLHIHLHIHDHREKQSGHDIIIQKLDKMGEELDNLTAEVTETKGIMASAKVLIEGFAKKLEAAGTDKAKLAALKEELNSGSEDLSAAIAANPLPTENVENPPAGGDNTGENGGTTA